MDGILCLSANVSLVRHEERRKSAEALPAIGVGRKHIGVPRQKLERAEQGSELMTLRQAETAANAYSRPLAALFLPDTPMEESLEAQCRRITEACARYKGCVTSA